MAKQDVADYLLARLREWSVDTVFAFPGDGINGILAAWGRADNDPQFVQSRHEEMSAFEAVGYAKGRQRKPRRSALRGPASLRLPVGGRRRTGQGDALMARVDVKITHRERVLFPDDGITKGDLVDYYAEIAQVMLPHLKGRPLTLTRYPGGIDEEGFLQQNFAVSLPDWMKRAEVAKKGDKKAGKKRSTVVHPVAQRREALIWAANQDCITPHAWLSRQPRLKTPDRLIFDLDPSDGGFAAVRATARALADVLDDLGLTAYVQTTGSRGLHVVTPLRGGADFDTARQFARDVADLVVADDPEHRTLEMRKDNRGDRVYLDVMRNAYAQTAVAPYAVRAHRGAPVATPLDWDELGGRGMRADRFTLRDVPKRMAERDDPWAHMRRHARSLSRARQRLAKRHI